MNHSHPKSILMSILMLLCITVPTWAQETVTPDWDALGRLAVLHEGRVKPLDTVARSSMLMICGKQSVTVQGRSMHALEWLMDVMCKPELSDRYRVFLIHDPDIEALLKLGEEDKRWSFMELQPKISLIADQAQQAQGVQSHQRNRYQRAILELYNHLTMYVMLKNSIAPEGSMNFGKEIAQLQSFTQWLTENPTHVDQDAIKQLNILKQHYETLAARSNIHFVPPLADLSWQRIGEHLRHVLAGVKMDPSVPLFAIIRASYREGNWAMINKMVADHLDRPQEQLPKVRSEAMFNRVALLVNAMPVYVVGLLITLLAMVKYNKLLKLGVLVVIIAFAMHTFGLGWRMWIEGRPPVINLYGSAVFIGWGATFMALIMEKIYKNGLSNIAATLIGFSTLIIAHHLSLSGDTIEPVRAVLNSNFWLSTHVIIVTLGYSAMFVAGAIGMLYVILQVKMQYSRRDTVILLCMVLGIELAFIITAKSAGLIFQNMSWPTFATGHLTSYVLIGMVTLKIFKRSRRINNEETIFKTMGRMAYGIICFAMLFSFVGTVLGGIWADQSWGRFWGWDPKENGALLIVLWNAATLHARWSGMIQIRGMMLMTLLGNCITAFSWFGVNMMGVGLHSYGFMDGAFFWLSAFWVSQLVLVAIGLFPVREIQSSTPIKKPNKSINTEHGS